MQSFIDQNQLLEILKTTDSDHHIKAPDLEKMLGVLERGANHNRAIRTAILKLTQKGNLIGSDSRGYFIIQNLEELRKYINTLEHYIAGNKARIRAIRLAWQRSHPKKHILKLRKNK